MLSAVILVNASHGSVEKVAQKLIDVKGIKQVYSVAGRFDLVIIAEIDDIAALSKIVNEKLSKIKDITSVETLVSMQVHSDKQLETMFSIGMNN